MRQQQTSFKHTHGKRACIFPLFFKCLPLPRPLEPVLSSSFKTKWCPVAACRTCCSGGIWIQSQHYNDLPYKHTRDTIYHETWINIKHVKHLHRLHPPQQTRNTIAWRENATHTLSHTHTQKTCRLTHIHTKLTERHTYNTQPYIHTFIHTCMQACMHVYT